jgi:tetratricopeptide (TPR) repeat protein
MMENADARGPDQDAGGESVNPPSPGNQDHAGKISRPRKLLFALTFCIGFLLILEAMSRLLAAQSRVFEEAPGKEPGTRLYNFTLNIRNRPIVMPKPAGVYRVMVFGESAADGWQIRGFPTWMNELVGYSRPPRPVEVYNFGAVGSNSTRIRSWYGSALDLDPDLVILYIGNNEMVEYTSLNPTEHPLLFQAYTLIKKKSRLYELLASAYNYLFGPSAKFIGYELIHQALNTTKAVTPESRRRAAEALYRDNLRSMISAAVKRGVKVVVLSPMGDLKDWPPLKSAHYETLSAERLGRFNELLGAARQALEQGDGKKARADLEAALALDPTYAEALYLYAKVLESEGLAAEAKKYYGLAEQYDDYPLRPLFSFTRISEQEARESGASFINMAKLLGEVAPDGIIGADIIYDYVHFRPAGAYEAARLLLRELVKQGLVPAGSGPVPGFEEMMARFPLDEQYEIDKSSAEILGFAFDNRFLMERAITAFGRVRDKHPENLAAALAQAVLCCRIGEPERAVEPLSWAGRSSAQNARKGAMLFFPGIMEIYQDQAVVSFDDKTNWQMVFARLAAKDMAPEKNEKRGQALPDFGAIPLEKMTNAFIWSEKDRRYINVSEEISGLQAQARKLKSRGPSPGVDLLKQGRSIMRLSSMQADWKHNSFIAESSDSFMVIQPLPADPLIAGSLLIKARFSAPDHHPNWMVIYWASARDPGFREDKKITFSWPIDDQTREMVIPLGQIIPLLQDRPISALRLDFTSQPARIALNELKIK